MTVRLKTVALLTPITLQVAAVRVDAPARNNRKYLHPLVREQLPKDVCVIYDGTLTYT